MRILGINISHHSSSCLLKDGEIEWFMEEARLAKDKHHHIEYFNGGFYGSKLLKDIDHIDHVIFTSFCSKWHDWRRIACCLQAITSQGCSFGEVIFDPYEHHLYHAHNAFYASGFDQAIALVMDGSGALYKPMVDIEGGFYRESESVYHCEYPDRILPKERHYSAYEQAAIEPVTEGINTLSNTFPAALIFSRVCESFGFGARGADAGKVMGMYAYGKPDVYKNPWYIKSKTGHWITDNTVMYDDMLPFFDGERDFQKQANIAYKLQEETKKYTMSKLHDIIDKYNPKNIVLSGGYFMNCVNNYAYLKAFPEINFFVDPIAFDSGTAIGAAKKVWYNITGDTTVRKFNNLYFGPDNAYLPCNK
jgi:carbamoyltransferase